MVCDGSDKHFYRHQAVQLMFNFLFIMLINTVGEEEADDLTIAGFIGTTFTFNVLCFILTAVRIRKVQNEIKKVTSQDDSYRHLDNLNTEKGK